MVTEKNTKEWAFETKQLHAGQEMPDSATGARAVPIYQTTSYVFNNSAHAEAVFALSEPGNIYTRLTNPTQEAFEKRMAALENGSAALAFASGAAAISATFMNLARCGDHIVSANSLYGGTFNLLAQTLPPYGITATFVDPDEEGSFSRAIKPNTKAIFVEVLGNPNSNAVDIKALADLAHSHGIPLVVDNTFASPYLLRPIEYGADIVVHSATKFIGGHGTTLGGVIIEGGNFDWAASGKFPYIVEPNPSFHGLSFYKAAGPAAFVAMVRATLLRDLGGCISPFNAFMLLQGLETLSLRVERHVYNALEVVKRLAAHPNVVRVHHPSLPSEPSHAVYKRYFPSGAGSIFSVDIAGGAPGARAFIDRLKLFSLLANVADQKSLAIHPASTTHGQLSVDDLLKQGITPGTVRLSIGTEHISDIWADLEQALNG